MTFNNFLYRQRQRIQYHVSRDPVIKRISEINRYKKIVSVVKEGYLINELAFLLPKQRFDFIFQPGIFDLFLSVPQNLDGRYELINGDLFIEFDDLKIGITSKSELYIINEIFVENCYQFLLPNDESVHVIDIGMNVGLASLYFAGLSHVKKVHAYEPFVPTFLQAKKNFRHNPRRARKIDPFNVGLGLKQEQIGGRYNCENNGINTTHHRNSWEDGNSRDRVQIESAFETINALLNLYDKENFVLKIDTEGAEYPIFESLFSKELSDRVRGIMLEWHFQGYQKLETTLLTNGFTVTSFRLSANSGLIYAFR